jgi:hypothetical protein
MERLVKWYKCNVPSVCVFVFSIISSYCSAYLMVLHNHFGERSGEFDDTGKAACELCIKHSYWWDISL